MYASTLFLIQNWLKNEWKMKRTVQTLNIELLPDSTWSSAGHWCHDTLFTPMIRGILNVCCIFSHLASLPVKADFYSVAGSLH